MSTSRTTGLARLGRLSEQSRETADQHAALRERFEPLASPGAAPIVVSSWQLFQTPEPLANRMAAMIPLVGRVLEPSAGLGRLYRAIRKLSDCHVTLIDNSAECCGVLGREISGDAQATLLQSDFLECDRDRLGEFDSVIANPPLSKGVDILHIQHAMQLLSPSGKIVSICANGPRQRRLLMPISKLWIDLPIGAFREAGTNVATAIVVIDNQQLFR